MPTSLEEKEIRTALSQGEGQFREFKSGWDRGSDPPKKVEWRRIRDKIADAVAAFANADGGMLFVGVEDDGRTDRPRLLWRGRGGTPFGAGESAAASSPVPDWTVRHR